MIKFYWSRVPGKFVNKHSGEEAGKGLPFVPPQFNGSVREWYETLIETVIDASNQMTSPADTVYVGPDVACIFECSYLFYPKVHIDERTNELGRISNRFRVRIDESLTTDVRLTSPHGEEAVVTILDLNII